MDMQRSLGIDLSDLSPGHQTDALCDIVLSLATRATGHIQQARQFSRKLPRHAITALLSVTLASHYQNQISKAGFNAFHGRLQHSHSPLKTLGLLMASWRKKI
jgi:phytoene/squalene synthetase